MMALKAAPSANNSLTSLRTPLRHGASPSQTRLESIARSALQRLHESPYRGLRGVELDVSGNTMVLTGQVRTFFLKQMAQHLLGEYCGPWEIKNNLRVA